MVSIKKIITRDKISTILFLIIPIVLVIIFIYICIIWNVVVSFSDWDGLRPSYDFKGFGQYQKLFTNEIFLTSLWNNIVLILIFVPGSLVMGLLLAILLDQKVRKENVFKLIYLLPFTLSFVVTGFLWRWMYNVRVGVLNTLLESIGLGFFRNDWIQNVDWAMFWVCVVLIWQYSGYMMLIFLAGIRSIPESQVMAAAVDGASGFQMYYRIIIPQLKAPIFTGFVLLLVFALKAFDLIFILTGGGPGYTTEILPLTMYKEVFRKKHFSYGSAIATILFLLIMIVVIPYLYKTYRREK
ncbi:MAG: ABC transporter permease [Promethearchaeota archaeon Loki_b32]|nr:MAG: ABC transporter permease [Candidatus Lokiarchaeota archaeon Loki_b32]